MLKILAAADIHMGRRSTHATDDIAPARLAWNKLVETTLDGQYDMLLLTGDLVDWDNHFFEAIGPLQTGLQQLDNAGIQVCLIAGNHDFKVLQQITTKATFQHVHFLGAGGNWETKQLQRNGANIAVTGWSFPARHHPVDPLASLPKPAQIADIHIGMVHGDLDLPKSQYAPLSRNLLEASGQDLWLLGHIHKPAHHILGNTHVFYPGSLQALSPKETGQHGALHIELNHTGHIQTYRWIPLSPIRYETHSIDATSVIDQDNLRKFTIDQLTTFHDSIKMEHPELEQLVVDIDVQMEKERHQTFQSILTDNDLSQDIYFSDTRMTIRQLVCTGVITNPDLVALMNEPSPAGRLAALIDALEKDTDNPLKDQVLNALEAEFRNPPANIFSKALDERDRQGKPIQDDKKTIIIEMARKLLVNMLETRQN